MPKADLKSLPFYDREQFTVASDTHIIDNKVYVSVVSDSPADRSGLKDGDELIGVGNSEVNNAEELASITESYRGQTVDVNFVRNGQPGKTIVTLNEDRGNQGYLGVGPANSKTFRATWSAPIVGAVTTAQFTEVSFRGLGYVLQNLFLGQAEVAGEAVGGPVATFKILSDTSALGITQVLFVVALISVSLGVMNVLPIPALDGGRLFVTLVFRSLKKRLSKEAEERIHGAGFALLMLLIVVITVVDIRRFF
jgi:regulator of sigma E protease